MMAENAGMHLGLTLLAERIDITSSKGVGRHLPCAKLWWDSVVCHILRHLLFSL